MYKNLIWMCVCSVMVIGAESEIEDQVQIPPEVIALAIAQTPLQR